MKNNRRNFLCNITLAIASSLLPKILQPCVPEVVEEEMVDITFRINHVVYNSYEGTYVLQDEVGQTVHEMTVRKSFADMLAKYEPPETDELKFLKKKSTNKKIN